MIGGYISCVSNYWQSTNPGEKYNDLEADGLNKLGICFDGNGTDRYKINGLKKWYFKNNKTILYTLGDILEELRKNALKYTAEEKKLKNGYNLLLDAYNMREKKSYIFESKDGFTSKRTQGHINYYNYLNEFIRIDKGVSRIVRNYMDYLGYDRRPFRSTHNILAGTDFSRVDRILDRHRSDQEREHQLQDVKSSNS